MKKVNIGLVGCGATRFMYGPYFKYLKNAKLYAIMDINETRAKDFKNRYGGERVYTNYEKFINDDNIDAVIIAVPTAIHHRFVIEAAKAKKHVYCEKPMARTIEEADEMILACKDNNVKLMIAFMKRFNKSFRLVKEIIEKGKIGDVFDARAIWDNARASATNENYRFQVASGGGFLQEDGSHPIDLCRWWLGEVEEVSAYGLVVAKNRVENDDVASVILKHKDGPISSLHITMLTHCIGEESYFVYGTKGTIVVQCPYHSSASPLPPIVTVWRNAKEMEDLSPKCDWNLENEVKASWQYLKELEQFCNCVIEDKEPPVTGYDGRAVVEIVNAAYISMKSRCKVRLPIEKSPDFIDLFGDLRNSCKWKIEGEGWWSRY